MKVNRGDAYKMITETKGKIFTVKFVKKDGTERTMNCRFGVSKYIKGGENHVAKENPNLIPVFDMQKEKYKMINLNTVFEVAVSGQTFQVL